MDDRLAKRMFYPRPLEDGGIAVRPGWFCRYYRIEKSDLDSFGLEFARPLWTVLATATFVLLWMLSLFVFSSPWATSPPLFLVIMIMVLGPLDPRVLDKRFRAAFTQARPAKVRNTGWFWHALPVSGVTGAALLAEALGILLVGWGLKDVFPDAYAQRTDIFGWPSYAFIGGGLFLVWVWALGTGTYYRLTRGCRLTYDNLIRTERPSSFEYTT